MVLYGRCVVVVWCCVVVVWCCVVIVWSLCGAVWSLCGRCVVQKYTLNDFKDCCVVLCVMLIHFILL